jgi:arylsulfatase A-like enzyme
VTHKAAQYINDHAADARAGKTVFLYLPLSSPHTPLVPTKEWAGKSPLGAYGDFVMQTDACAGEVAKAIDDAGLTDNTLLVFTSDNGFASYVGPEKLERLGHFPSAQFRGYKSEIWDGGHRIPFIVRWPNRVKANTASDQLVCLGDLIRTCADILGQPLPDDAAEDSVSILPALLGTAKGPLREAVVHHSAMGKFAIRQGNWKLELCAGSGGWGDKSDGEALKKGLPFSQLYDMSADIGEKSSVLSANPQVVERLTALLQKYVADGRSTPGKPQKNDVPIDIFKQPKPTTGPSPGD